MCLQSKRWLTTEAWGPASVLLPPEQIHAIRDIWPVVIQPQWDPTYKRAALSWLGRLKELLTTMGRDTGGISHCEGVLEHMVPEFLPSGVSIQAKIGSLRSAAGSPSTGTQFHAVGSLAHAMNENIASAFPSYAASRPLISVSGDQGTADSFCTEVWADGMMIVYRNTQTSAGVDPSAVPIRLGRILRLVDEVASDAYAVVESWWPVMKDKGNGRHNIFGTWVQVSKPCTEANARPEKRAKTKQSANLIVATKDILVWPIPAESGNSDFGDGLRIPFAVFHFLRAHHGLDLSHYEFSWARRGRAFYMEVIKDVATTIRQQQHDGRTS